MSDTIIRVENLGKKYILGHQKQERYTALRDVMANGAKSLGRKVLKPFGKKIADPAVDEFWALNDVSFEIKQGDRVGIIGRNGAGKSTLLKILSRITEPTRGSIRIKGRVASLLEVGTGFHPELTGRENIYLNGAILGMSKVEIKKKFDEIVEFAEVEKFLDTPVKRYSSGMYVRLAFAVAAHLEPEILVVDEVLAVGDAQFQQKCLGKMEDVATKEGRTVLFVSHSMQAISTLTQSCVFLNQGKVIKQGSTEEVISEYLSYDRSQEHIYVDQPSENEPKITKVEVITSEPGNTHTYGKPFEINFEIYTPHILKGGALAIHLVNNIQQSVIHIWLFDSETPVFRKAGTHYLKCKIPKLRLYKGHYTTTIYFAEHKTGNMLQTLENICPFEVVMFQSKRDYEWYNGMCAYLEDFTWEI